MSTKSMVIVLIGLIALLCLLQSSDAHCRRRDRGCCRKRFQYGGCFRHERRWGYNASCGSCAQFDYSGCGGDENNFESLDDCNSCCRGTPACPKYTLSKPPEGCEYKWEDGADGCPRPKLECACRETFCRPDSCRTGERCIPEETSRPCKKFRCQTDPCFAVQRQLRPCEKCVSVPAPKCDVSPCPLVAVREDHCAPEPPRCPPVVECPQRCRINQRCVAQPSFNRCPEYRCVNYD